MESLYRTVGFLSISLLLFQRIARAQINVSPNQTAAALAQKLAGEGVIITNPSLTCASEANGFFNVVNSNLGLDSGIVLTTGRAATIGTYTGVNGPATMLASNDDGMPGDPTLEPLAGATTFDACSLEFDLLPAGDSIKFSYVFSSEEYKNAVCGPYNDAFAFFITGPGISGVDNMALVPGTNIPVTINTINDGDPGIVGNIRNCTMMGPGSPFTAYYINNSSGTTLTHYGLTDVLRVAHAVIPCGVYHLRIAIADAGDPLYDSGVFLLAGSLQTNSFNINADIMPIGDTSEAYCVKGCLPGNFQIRRSAPSPQPQTIKFLISGSAVSSFDYSPITDSVVIPAGSQAASVVVNGLPTPLNGPRIITLSILSPYSCSSVNDIVDSASLIIYDTLYVNMLTPDTTICNNESLQLQVSGNSELTYTWSPAAGLSNTHVEDPVASPGVNTTYEVTASLPGSACLAKTAEVTLTVKMAPAIRVISGINVCFNNQFALDASPITPNPFYSYQWSGPGAFTSTQPDTLVSNAAAENSGAYTISVINDTNGCKTTGTVNVVVTVPDTPQVVSPVIVCLNSTPDSLSATGNHILWYNDADSTADTSAPVPPTGQIAVYNYYVTQTINNCESPKTPVEVEVKKCCDGNIFIPNAFTPNGDGLNDKFQVVADYGYFIESVYIFNRWGQVVYCGLNNDGWDGTFGGKRVDLGTYFYNITFGCVLGGAVQRKGDITLIR